MGGHFAQYDPDRAKKLLDEMGLKYDSAGKARLRPDGKPLVLTLEFAQYAGPRTKMLELIKETVEAVGIQVALKQIDQGLYSQRTTAGALETTMWNLDSTTEIGFHRNPLAFLPYANDWTLWLNTAGRNGEEPSKEVKDFFALSDRFMQVPLGSEEYRKAARELVWLSLNNLWNIGVIGQIPKPVVIRTSLGNTPGAEATYSWDYRFWAPFLADHWYFKK
jgi:peptide/nickel transport system substrate-binding protein